MSFPLIPPKIQFLDNSGNPLSAGSIEFRSPSTNIYIPSYPTADDADAATNANANPLILNSRGEAPVGIFLSDNVSYKVILKDSSGDTIWTIDDVQMPVSLSSTYTPGFTGAVARTFQSRLDDFVSVKDFGAVGDGSTDDTAAVVKAVAYSSANGVPVSGRGFIYAVTGNISLLVNTHLEDAVFKQLTPAAAGNVRTLTSSSVDNIKLINVSVNRNGDGTNGSISNDGGIWIGGGSNHLLENCEVYGDDKGNGIVLANCSDSRVLHPHVHDLNFVDAAASDDQLQGLWLDDCTNIQVESPYIESLGGDVAGRPRQHTRGIVTGGCNGIEINAPFVKSAGQGIDVTGQGSLSTGYNRHVQVNGGTVRDIDSYGCKWANVSQRCQFIGVKAIDCGYAGFVASAGAASTHETQDNTWIGCEAYDTGANGFWSGSNPAGFLILQGTTTTVPNNIKAIGCRAIDTQSVPTMVDGFRNQVPGAANALNQLIDCQSIGHTGVAFNGFHVPSCRAFRNNDVSIGDSAWTSAAWDLEGSAVDDTSSMHDVTTNNSRIYIYESGYYVVDGNVTFAANATGIREARIALDGTAVTRSNVFAYADGTQQTTLSVHDVIYVDAGSYVEIQCYQSSGAGLNLDASHSGVNVYKVA